MSELYKKGDVIGGKFEVHRTLGKGGFGVVYLTLDRAVCEQCALKTFRDEFLADGKAREAFKKEALLWVNLGEHPFILSASLVVEFSGRLFVKMDYVAPDNRGRTNLSDHLVSAGGPLNPDQTLEWAIQFCLGMEHAVSHGIKCHRDIKPSNIFITQDGRLKIADFGLAAAAEVAWQTAAGQVGSVVTGSAKHGFGLSLLKTEGKGWCGTPGYIPPEVYRYGTADIRSDIYTFGLVLWQMAAGNPSPPFLVSYGGEMEPFLRGVYRQQLTGCVPPVVEPLHRIIERCLRPDPTDRYQHFGELREDCTLILRDRTGKTVQAPEVDKQTGYFWRRKGMSLHALGRYEEALGCCNQALAIDQRDAAAWNNKGLALGALGRHEEAIVCYDEALVIDPRNAGPWNNKGLALYALGRHEEAIVCYDKALVIDPRYAVPWNNKGNALNALGRSQEALRYYDLALVIDPRDREAWYSKGTVLAVLGRSEEALGCFDQALAIDSRYARAWYNKGNALDVLGRSEEALGCFDQALAIDSRYARAWYSKALSEDKLQQSGAAVRSYGKFVELAPVQNPEAVAYARRRLQELEGK